MARGCGACSCATFANYHEDLLSLVVEGNQRASQAWGVPGRAAGSSPISEFAPRARGGT